VGDEESHDEQGVDLPSLYAEVVDAYRHNSLRAGQARLTQARLELAVPAAAVLMPKVGVDIVEQLPDDLRQSLDEVAKIEKAEYLDWSYVACVSFLVYYTTLFDTFLQDTIEFLLCAHPGAMSDYPVPFGQVVKSAARHEVLNAALKTKVREIGFMSFSERLRWLQKRFGVRVALDDPTREELAKCSEARNVAVHDQGWFEFCFSEDGTVAASQTGCPLHPNKLTWEDASAAKRTFGVVVAELAEAVYSQVLNCELPDSVRGTLEVLRGLDA